MIYVCAPLFVMYQLLDIVHTIYIHIRVFYVKSGSLE